MVHAAQIRAARALLGWRQEDLAKASGIGTATIQRIEKGEGVIQGYISTALRLREAFETAGVQFLDNDNAGGIGVRLLKS